MPKREQRICAHCNKRFITNHEAQRYCSSGCFGLARRGPQHTVTCEECGATMVLPPFKAERRRFCSVDCWRRSVKEADNG
jgi:hypothetical protein